MPLHPGVRLGAYEIVALVGSGGMGEVYRARDPRLGRDVAIKVVASIGADAERLRRFEQEARAAAVRGHRDARGRNAARASSTDLWVLPMTGERKPAPFLESKFNETSGRFSPDGKWVAYISNESARPEPYVTSFPQAGGRWQISAAGGAQPRWRAEGTELSFRDLSTGGRAAAEVRSGASGFTVTKITPLFPVADVGARSFFDVSPDGQKFLVNAIAQDTSEPRTLPMTVVTNWPAALKKEP